MATYTRYQNVALNNVSQPIPHATIAVLNQPANTSTTPGSPLATIYSDSLATPMANPFTADGNGNYDFYAATGIYTIQVYGANIVGQFVNPDVTINGISAVNTPWLNVIDFGADPAGVLDSSVAFQNAINATVAKNTLVYAPSGTYKITSELTNASAPHFRGLFGDGPNSTFLSFTGLASGNGIIISNAPDWLNFHGFSMTGPGASIPAHITSWSVSSNVVTFNAVNSFSPGQVVLVQNFNTNGNRFNNQFLTVTAASGTQFAAHFTTPDGSGTDSGVAAIDRHGIKFSTIGALMLTMDEMDIGSFPNSGILFIQPVVSKFYKLRAMNNGWHGFNIIITPPRAVGETATQWDSCWSLGNGGAGWYGHYLQTSTFNNCAGEACQTGIILDFCQSIVLNAFHCEQIVAGVYLPGDGIRLQSCRGITVNSMFTIWYEDSNINQNVWHITNDGTIPDVTEGVVFNSPYFVLSSINTPPSAPITTLLNVSSGSFGLEFKEPFVQNLTNTSLTYVDNGTNTVLVERGITISPVSITTTIDNNPVLTLTNVTPATSGNNPKIPALKIGANVWNGTASISDVWQISGNVAPGANPFTSLQVSHNGSTGPAAVQLNIGTSHDPGSFAVQQNSAATNSANLNGPLISTVGEYWDGTQTQTDQWGWQGLLGTGANPTSTLVLNHFGTPGKAAVSISAPVTTLDLSCGKINPVNAPAVTSANVAFSGWGTGASINFAGGSMTCYTIGILVGTTPSANPTITVTYPTPWATFPVILTTPQMSIAEGFWVVTSSGTNSVTFTYSTTPTHIGASYDINVLTIGF